MADYILDEITACILSCEAVLYAGSRICLIRVLHNLWYLLDRFLYMYNAPNI